MRRCWVLAVVALVGTMAAAAEMVGVPGSGTQYPSEIDAAIGGKAVKLRLTGTALRTKLLVNVYALGSYVQKGMAVGSAEALAAADCPKRLHLVMERTVDGKDMAEAFQSAVRLNYAEPAFADEIHQLVQFMRATTARTGEHIYLTHVPGIGVQISAAAKADFLIKNVAFSKAVWDIYLGQKNLGEAIKRGLTSRL
jgi:hypothetical protein